MANFQANKKNQPARSFTAQQKNIPSKSCNYEEAHTGVIGPAYHRHPSPLPRNPQSSGRVRYLSIYLSNPIKREPRREPTAVHY